MQLFFILKAGAGAPEVFVPRFIPKETIHVS